MPLTERRAQRSLFGEILDWMLAPLLLLWPMSLVITGVVASDIANRPYDRELGERAMLLARQVVIETQAASARNPLGLPAVRIADKPLVRLLLRQDEVDQVFIQILGARGELVEGDRELPVPEDALRKASVQMRDERIREEPVRVAYLWVPIDGHPQLPGVLVQIAETLRKRSQLTTEIVKGVILPQFIVLPLAVLLVWLALARGLNPLNRLQLRIRSRESTDLSPIEELDAPEEVAPLVRAINDLLARLDQSITAQKHFLADAAHQLKTPLAGLRTQAELATREIDAGTNDPRTLKAALHNIALSSERAAHSVNQLLAMARAENSDINAIRQRFNLATCVRDALHDFVPTALEKRIDIGYEGPEPSPATLMVGQPVLVSELVRNLIDNALKYTPYDGLVTVRLADNPTAGEFVLQVEDSGPGIPPAERERVFQPFYRTLGTGVDGTGLGLAIVLEIAQRHGATVTIEDAPERPGTDTLHPRDAGSGPGALFTVRLPKRPPTL
ncbi:MAG: sensor histidine kinase [Rubrivivax sp.]